MNKNNHSSKYFIAGILLLTVIGLFSQSRGILASTHNETAELFESSFAYEASGKTARALNDVLNILRSDPNHYVANLRVGWLYYLEGRHNDAIVFYEKASRDRPLAIEPMMGQMLPQMAAEQWDEAEELGEQILQRAPGNYTAATRLAYIYFIQNKYRKAEEQYNNLLEEYPSDLDMMLGLGWTYVKLGRLAEARSLFEAVLAIRSSNVSAQAGLDIL